VKGMSHKKASNRFLVLSDLSEGEDDLDATLSDNDYHETLPICFGDYLAIAMDKRGMNDKRSISRHRGLVNQTCMGSSLGRERSLAGSEHRSIPSLQHDSVEHVNKILLENLDPIWFKICREKGVRQNLNPFLEARKAL
jgi:hypothetical protein